MSRSRCWWRARPGTRTWNGTRRRTGSATCSRTASSPERPCLRWSPRRLGSLPTSCSADSLTLPLPLQRPRQALSSRRPGSQWGSRNSPTQPHLHPAKRPHAFPLLLLPAAMERKHLTSRSSSSPLLLLLRATNHHTCRTSSTTRLLKGMSRCSLWYTDLVYHSQVEPD